MCYIYVCLCVSATYTKALENEEAALQTREGDSIPVTDSGVTTDTEQPSKKRKDSLKTPFFKAQKRDSADTPGTASRGIPSGFLRQQTHLARRMSLSGN